METKSAPQTYLVELDSEKYGVLTVAGFPTLSMAASFVVEYGVALVGDSAFDLDSSLLTALSSEEVDELIGALK